MSRRNGRCCECGGIYGHHMTGCPETPDVPDEWEDDRNAGEPSDDDDVVFDD